ncbi:hypothetical protein ACSBLW_17715 [Thioclava sp. FR2]|uniref:hypothetical protein n=1 Tax=Thioclava sp. FR2 TaxID=3445780 RepID=UPI003EBE99F2
MALELIAAIVASFVLGGLALILRKLSGNRLPKWFVSAAAGVGLIGFTIWSEYDWFARVSDELPEGVEVVWHPTEAMPLRPWTYLAPITTRFVAMDVRSVAAHPNNPDLRMAKLFNFARWTPVRDGLVVVDCMAKRHVLVTEGVEITAEGALKGGEWTQGFVSDEFETAACKAS